MSNPMSCVEKLRLLNQVIVSVVGSTKYPTRASIAREKGAVKNLLQIFLERKPTQEEIEMAREDIFPQIDGCCKEKAPRISP